MSPFRRHLQTYGWLLFVLAVAVAYIWWVTSGEPWAGGLLR